MQRNTHREWLCVTLAACAMLWPADAHAQRGPGGRGHVVRPVIVARPYFYGSYFYRPYYDPFFWGFYGWYPSPYWSPYALYPPYPVYGGYGDAAARIQVTPQETEVYVDGYFAGIVDDFDGFAQRLRLPLGEHEIELYLEGYRTVREKLLFRPGATLKIRTTMEPLAPGAAQEPRPQQPQPARPPSSLPPRETRPDAPPPDERTSEGSESGTLSIRVQPSGATVLVDGEQWEGPEGSERLEIQLSDGRHRVEIEKEGYRKYFTEVHVRRGEMATLNVSLSPEERR